MTLGLYDPDRRYRRRVWGAIIRIGFYVVTIGVASVFAYQIGVEQSKNREEQLAARVSALESARQTLEQNAIRLEAAAQTAQIQYRDLLTRFEQEVPRGDLRVLSQLVATRLQEGVAPERLAFFINAADQVRDCAPADTKRFILPTPIYQGPNTAVGFADGRITVSGMGANATGEDGAPLGWFDPTQDVKITFTLVGGEQSEVSGAMPLYHSVVLGDREFRFTITQGERSFVEVTADNCALPGQG
ncbi:hypothetical protein [Inquilinus sp. CAU 1745]|uniref:hypothetical protein n=1 Tax=Inquilinus sp. CAU 1745 TaxID=3140369 RepID=UPI00325AC87D